MNEIIKIVNHGKNGIYLYVAIVLTAEGYFFTESVLLKDKKEKKSFNFNGLKINKKLNEYSMDKYKLNS